METDYSTLIEKAREAMAFSYSPYSHFAVGSCILTKDGKMYTGSNIENASYGITCCAERVALYNAVSSGKRAFRAVAIISNSDSYIYPCGVCRQAIAEFDGDEDIDVISAKNSGGYIINKLKDLLPHTFSGKDIE